MNQPPRISLKPFLIVLVLIPFNSYFLIKLEIVHYNLLTNTVPLSNVVFALVILTAINWLLKKFIPPVALNQGELMLVYVMLSLATTLGSLSMVSSIVPRIGHAFWFDTPENEWRQLFWRYIPRWLTVDDKRALKAYYDGGSSFYHSAYMKVWLPRVGWWVFIFSILGFTMLCINALVRRQWSEREKLTYPIIKMAMEVTDSKGRFLKNRIMWLGFGIAACISLLNGLNHLYPFVPYVPVTRWSYEFEERPWSLIGSDGVEPASTTIAFYPFAMGIGFLMPLEILSSTTIFFALYRAEVALGTVTGNPIIWEYQTKQIFGTLVGLCVLLIWRARKHIADVVRTFTSKTKDQDDSDEPIPYRIASVGLVLGMAILVALLWEAGMTLWLIMLFLALYFLLSFVITRIRAESGIYVHAFHAQEPRVMISEMLGTRALGPKNLTMLAVFSFNYTYRAHDMPQQLEALEVAKRTGMGRKSIVSSILLITVFATAVAFVVQLGVYYNMGAASGRFSNFALDLGDRDFDWLNSNMVYTTVADHKAISFMGIGFLMLIFTGYMRTRFIWWPLHPLGLVMAGNDEMEDLWLPIMLCWLIKWVILRHGGHRVYTKAVYFFLGLALGDFIVGSLWNVLSLILDQSMYVYYP